MSGTNHCQRRALDEASFLQDVAAVNGSELNEIRR
jgi:hypothetical protein